MEMLGRIRRMHLRDKLSLHEIAKRTGLSRNTVRSWLRTPEEVQVPMSMTGKESSDSMTPNGRKDHFDPLRNFSSLGSVPRSSRLTSVFRRSANRHDRGAGAASPCVNAHVCITKVLLWFHRPFEYGPRSLKTPPLRQACAAATTPLTTAGRRSPQPCARAHPVRPAC